MAGFQDVLKDGSKRGRPAIKAYRITTANPNGGKTINIQLPVRLYTKDAALTCKAIVDSIEAARALGLETTPPRTTALIELYPDFKQRLAKKGLIPSKEFLTLAELWTRYIQEQGQKDGWKPNTFRNKGVSSKKFFEYFKSDQRADSVTKQQAQAFKDWLLTVSSAQTAAGYVKDAKAAFNWAVDMELIEKTPFEGIAKGSFENKTRETYVSLEIVERILTACPSQEWRAVVLLWRRAGLRKDEPKELRWSDIDFEKGLMTVHSPKTERYKNRGLRVVPLFPDVKKELEALRLEQQTAGVESAFVFVSLRKIKQLFIPFKKIVIKAGVEPWEKLIQNLRSSAAIDISETFGATAESEWLGHSQDTARKHYLHTPPAVIEQARQWNGKTA